ncbi:MAG: hypothetical protein N3B01_10235 [Verrucomicrobiae bacterium]|nr:hypothetical protein [Verrucomicrobiae bacterium]
MTDTSFRTILEKMDLHEIERLKLAKQAITWLEGRRRALQEQIAAVDEQIAGIKEGRIDPRTVLPKPAVPEKPVPHQRRTSEGSLANRILAVLRAKNAEMTLEEIAKAVLDGGYQTRSKNFRQLVLITISGMDTVERVGRGLYRAKPTTESPS